MRLLGMGSLARPAKPCSIDWAAAAVTWNHRSLALTGSGNLIISNAMRAVELNRPEDNILTPEPGRGRERFLRHPMHPKNVEVQADDQLCGAIRDIIPHG
ncbi:MAG: hypothetical protein H7A53_07760 [Akkermansiaceae bacterium]|nr:hypothetical protein [Akkermansiaceae bacterium]